MVVVLRIDEKNFLQRNFNKKEIEKDWQNKMDELIKRKSEERA